MTGHAEIPVGRGAQNLVDRANLARMASSLEAAVLRGRGVSFVPAASGRFFCGGIDLAELHPLPAGEVRRAFIDLLAFVRSVFHAPVPVETRAPGHAVGVGAMLLLAADRAWIGDAARLRFPEGLLGLSVFDDVVALIRHRSSGRVAERLLVSAEAVGGAEAVALGLADGLIEGGEAAPVWPAAPPGPAFPALKALCRHDVTIRSLESQVDRFMALWQSDEAQARIAAHLGSQPAGSGASVTCR